MSNSLTFNKIAGAVLGTALAVFVLREAAGMIYEPHMASKDLPGYKIEVAEDDHGGGDKGGEAVAEVPIGKLLSTADATKGAAEAKSSCGSCHEFAKGVVSKKAGPSLWDVVERASGRVPDFAYSTGMLAREGKPWVYEDLNAFIKAPKATVKGTKMGFGGLKNDEKRANLIAYLASLSDAPKPFPAP